MNTLGKDSVSPHNHNIESEERQRTPLPRSEDNGRCLSLDFSPSIASEDIVLNYLADILVEFFLDQQAHEQASGDLLPRVNKRTG
jgi:hypothetical protein